MSNAVLSPPRSARTAGRWCRECGYSLRGLPPNRLCPECGHPSEDRVAQTSPHTAWSRSVCAGLVLLLGVTLHAVSSVLIQPFSDQIGGTGPALNLPGPKLWAMPLLQRPIGHAPEQPGVVGTRTAMLSLLAVWLITAPLASSRMQRDGVLRLITRWTSVTLFGIAFGVMMGCQGLWPEQLPPFRMVLAGGVELPATTLLYLYLRRLSMNLPGRERRGAFDRLVWCAPMIILIGTLILGAQWWLANASGRNPAPPAAFALTWTAGYGAIAMLCGVACSAAVASLAIAFLRLSFPSARRTLRWFRAFANASWLNISRDQLRRFAVAGGLALLLVVMLLGNERTIWMWTREGFGGNLPFVNFPGPKIWASAASAIVADGSWPSLTAVMQLITLNLVAVFLIATPLRRDTPIRFVNRWGAVLLFGASIAIFMVLGRHLRLRGLLAPNRTELFAAAMVICELPATTLLYVLLAHIAEDVSKPRLAHHFRTLCLVIVTMVATALLMFALSSRLLSRRTDWITLSIAAVYGAIALLSAAWGTMNVVRLMGAIVTKDSNEEARTTSSFGLRH